MAKWNLGSSPTIIPKAQRVKISYIKLEIQFRVEVVEVRSEYLSLDRLGLIRLW